MAGCRPSECPLPTYLGWYLGDLGFVYRRRPEFQGGYLIQRARASGCSCLVQPGKPPGLNTTFSMQLQAPANKEPSHIKPPLDSTKITDKFSSHLNTLNKPTQAEYCSNPAVPAVTDSQSRTRNLIPHSRHLVQIKDGSLGFP